MDEEREEPLPQEPAEDIHTEDFESNAEGLFLYLEKLCRFLPEETRRNFLESGMKLRISSLRSQIEGHPGLRRLIESKYSTPQGEHKEKVELTGERLKGTLDFIRNLTAFHPDKDTGFALSHKLGSLMKSMKDTEYAGEQ